MTDNAYREFQFSWLLLSILVPIHLLVTVMYIYQFGDRPIPTDAFIAVTAVMVLVVLLFYGMTTTIEGNTILVSFGIGLISKRIDIARVRDVAAVETPWYYGYGIRLIPNGWLYNVSGRHAVELRFIDRNRVIRIGTKNPLRLKQALENRVGVNQ